MTACSPGTPCSPDRSRGPSALGPGFLGPRPRPEPPGAPPGLGGLGCRDRDNAAPLDSDQCGPRLMCGCRARPRRFERTPHQQGLVVGALALLREILGLECAR